jgi:hypothetical protein
MMLCQCENQNVDISTAVLSTAAIKDKWKQIIKNRVSQVRKDKIRSSSLSFRNSITQNFVISIIALIGMHSLLNTEIVVKNPARGVDVCPSCLYCLVGGEAINQLKYP